MKRAFVFPGQGAQFVGMGKELANAYPSARAAFEEVDEALDEHLSRLIWEGDQKTLTLTANAQPALMVTSVAAFRALESEGLTIEDGTYVAGHSLGEYSALAVAGSLTLPDTARLLRIRGTAMQAAVANGHGAMVAILGLDLNAVREVVHESAGDQVCQIANDNDPAQVVVSGHKEAVDRAIENAKERGAKRSILLPVSAPFHCSLMDLAAKRMLDALIDVTISLPKIPLIANTLAEPVSDPERIRKLLVDQVTGVVRWREIILMMGRENIEDVWEIGAGKALSGMVRRTNRGITTRNIAVPADVLAAMTSMEQSNDVQS
ncbi:MAG: ACP S-malonyltransferase [Aestuariivita sp.]|nr:ACP S-malonyltransferase [Aestuariivita sp.]MCY4203152.1 ACP S-malonyltransferase [Aestuariivita sp.]MCY4289310.1 ACP S-malonyltransferase [Aestuariivita sp.]MCY4347806.1 ACP S-malonyltransferase [Aestuariivita sp.]